MRLASSTIVVSLFGFFAVCSVLTGCPGKSAPADKPTAEQPERAEPDDEGKAADTKRPAAVLTAPPPARPVDDKKPDDDKDKGGW